MDECEDTFDVGARFREIGEIVWLVRHSPLHAQLRIDELDELFLAPLAAGQVRRWKRGRAPVALASWAWLSEEAEGAYLDTGRIPDGRWNSGKRLWFVDVIAPFGDARAVSRELREMIPPGAHAKSARWTETGELRKIGRFPGRPVV